MGAMPDLTLEQISARCTNKQIAKYIASMPDLPEGITVCKFLAIFLYSARKAQFRLNGELTKKGDDRQLETYSLADRKHKLFNKDGDFVYQVTVYKLEVAVSENREEILPLYTTSI
ncbi:MULTISPECIES: hypothetical protein [unclassified Nostoc]|uniref:hypothetical protein n=2 Tax=Nostoc TaxID=1177 RepID=UPI000B953C2C|nr:hypothetical protein [Nostoc sp. 'Peltigera membranacea cyanobiont' 232]OYE05166.1 hypothetical protein CDG79_09550 [Nostoc sp. 'Peltigera membranacea cyanobiont' 232]